MIPFNQPFIVGKELEYISEAVALGRISGDGHFTQMCAQLLAARAGAGKVLMTPSCTAALELAAILCDVQPGDEVIVPSFTFVSSASAFARLGARPVFVDIREDTLNLDEMAIESAITPRTRAIVPVHYAGVGCEMNQIMQIAGSYGLRVVEDAAQGVNSFYHGKGLGAIGDLGTYSFHETKCFISGEGGALCINDPELIERAEILRDKGTNRSQFFRGEVDKYTWVDLGSSYVPSEVACAFLYAQLQEMEAITARRAAIYQRYLVGLRPLEQQGDMQLPRIPEGCEINYHLMYALLSDETVRDAMIAHLKSCGVQAVFHYVPLHTSPMGRKLGGYPGQLPRTESLSRRLLRLPLYHSLTETDQNRVINSIASFFQSSRASNRQPTSCAT